MVARMSAAERLEYVRSLFAAEEYKLTSLKCKQTSGEKFSYLCPNRHEWQITPSNWRKGVRCPFCMTEDFTKKAIDRIQVAFVKEGYELKLSKYSGWDSKFEYLCPQGHPGTISWAEWRNGRRCEECFGIHLFTGKPNPLVGWEG